MSRKSSGGEVGAILLIIGATFSFLWAFFKYPIPTIIGINILTLVFSPDNFGTVFSISAVIGIVYFFIKGSKKQLEGGIENQKIEELFGERLSATLLDRNEDIIQKNLGTLHDDSWPYYIENEVRDCIIDIALAENKKEFAPTSGEYLKNWSTRTNLPKEWLDLKDYLLKRFKSKFDGLKEVVKKREEERKKEVENKIENKGQEILERNKDLVDKFFEITERKVSVIDDYGDENWEVLPNEILACLKKISQKEGFLLDIDGYLKGKRRGRFSYDARALPDEYAWLQRKLEKAFKEYHEKEKAKPTNGAEINNLSGVEFEVWVSKLLKENGFIDIRGTPATGDQGADLIAKRGGQTIIIQAKRYQGTVGNKAVQEVASAVQFYSGDEGWVITNSTFTPSAKALAQKSGVRLIDGRMLNNIGDYIN